jgi:hypothetical protein
MISWRILVSFRGLFEDYIFVYTTHTSIHVHLHILCIQDRLIYTYYTKPDHPDYLLVIEVVTKKTSARLILLQSLGFEIWAQCTRMDKKLYKIRGGRGPGKSVWMLCVCVPAIYVTYITQGIVQENVWVIDCTLLLHLLLIALVE